MKLFQKKNDSQDRMEAELNYRRSMRELKRCEDGMAHEAESCRSRICEAERAGRHSDALRQVKFYRTLTAMQGRIGDLRGRMEMLYTMQGLTGALSGMARDVAGQAGLLQGLMEPSKLASGQRELSRAMLKLDELLQRSEMLLEPLGDGGGESVHSAEDEALLGGIMRRQQAEERRDQLRDEHHRAIADTSARLNERLQTNM